MDPTALRKNFEEQISQTESQIKELEENLAKAKEYRTKLTGGLETLNLLEQDLPDPPSEDSSSES